MFWPFKQGDAQRLGHSLKDVSSSHPTKNEAQAAFVLETIIDQGINQVLKLRPDGPGLCDHNPLERAVNVITSLPYALVGIHALKNRRTKEGKIWGASLLGVTGGAVAFHASKGKARPICRKIDYWCIALSSTCLFRAIFPQAPLHYSLLSLVATPFAPFNVSSANVAAMEVEFYRRAALDTSENQALKNAQLKHLATAVVGSACFFIEDLKPDIPLVHSTWHGLSIYSTALCNNLLAAVEDEQLGGSKAIV